MHKLYVTALAAFSLALAVAGPAAAEDNSSPTTNKGCTVTLQNPDGSAGQSVVYDHGYSFSIVNKATGKTHTYKCNNGKWEETVAMTVPGRRVTAVKYAGTVQVQSSGAARVKGRTAPAGGKYASQLS